MKVSWPRLNASVPYLRQVAGGATFQEVVWCDVEPRPGERDWSHVDEVARLSRKLGFTLNLKIRVGACWATRQGPSHTRGKTPKTESRMPRDMNAYADFVAATVKRYAPRGVREFAVENEPDASWFWGGTVDQLVSLTRVAASAIHAADPDAKVVSWGVASPSYGAAIASRLLARHRDGEAVAAYGRYYRHRPPGDYPRLSSVAQLRGFLAGDDAVRALSYLHAAERLLAEGVFDVRQVHFYEPWDNVPALLDYLRATTPKGVPLEVWEAGAFWLGGPSNSRPREADAIKTVALLLAGGARRVIWLPIMSSSVSGGTEKRYGLLTPEGGPRPVSGAFRRLVESSRGTSRSPVDVGGLRGVAFDHGATTDLAVWSDRGRTLPRPSGVTVSARDLTGRPVGWPPDGLRVTREPMLLTLAAPGSRALQLLAPSPEP